MQLFARVYKLEGTPLGDLAVAIKGGKALVTWEEAGERQKVEIGEYTPGVYRQGTISVEEAADLSRVRATFDGREVVIPRAPNIWKALAGGGALLSAGSALAAVVAWLLYGRK